jgi:hypothetical protein
MILDHLKMESRNRCKKFEPKWSTERKVMPILLKVYQVMVFQGHNSKSPDSKRANQGRKQKHLFPLVTLWIQDLLEPQESTTGSDTN